MTLPLAAALAALITLTIGACSQATPERPLIVVTTNILGDVLTHIVGDEAEVMTLMRPDADPHSFEISAREAAGMQGAELLISNGLGLEEGLQQHIDAAGAAGVPMFAAGDVVETIPYSSADAVGALDPHFWTDPAQMITVVQAAAEAITAYVDGVDEQQILRNAEAYAAQLRALDAEMESAFAAIPAENRRLVTNHHVFGYLAERFDFTITGAVVPGGSTLAAPSASDLRELVTAIEDAGVATIFADSSQPDRLMQVLADEASVRVDVVALFTESLTAPGGGADNYLAMMRANTQRITTGLAPSGPVHNQ
jgi:zinc/manganese transport system substrate-binding protein